MRVFKAQKMCFCTVLVRVSDQQLGVQPAQSHAMTNLLLIATHLPASGKIFQADPQYW